MSASQRCVLPVCTRRTRKDRKRAAALGDEAKTTTIMMKTSSVGKTGKLFLPSPQTSRLSVSVIDREFVNSGDSKC